jgi:pyrimidine-nucleoside phosphorylase
VNARIIGEASVVLGAGRSKKDDPIDHTVGMIVHHRVGDWVERGQPLLTIHARRTEEQTGIQEKLKTAFGWSKSPVEPLPLFYK